KMNGVGGLHGWRWLFLLEGVAPVVLGFVTLSILPDRPSQARWLTPSQARWIEEQLAREHVEHSGHHVAKLTGALRDPHLWLLSVIYFMLIMGLYGFIYWVPTIIKNASGASDFNVGLLSAVPYLVAACSMVVIGHHADRTNERRRHVAISAVIAAGGVVVISQCRTTAAVMPALCLAAVGIWGSLAPFWALSTRFLRGT